MTEKPYDLRLFVSRLRHAADVLEELQDLAHFAPFAIAPTIPVQRPSRPQAGRSVGARRKSSAIFSRVYKGGQRATTSVQQAGTKTYVHWTQRPENKAKLAAVVAKMSKGRQKSRRK